MNKDDLRALSERTAARASALASKATRRQPRPARTAETAKPATPAAVPPAKPRRRPPLAVVTPLPTAQRRPKITPELIAAVRARGQRRKQAAVEPDALRALFRPAEPPPGVLPKDTPKLAMDSTPGVAWAGDWVVNAGYFEGMTFLGYPILSELALRTEYRKVSERLSTEMTRKWLELTSTSDDDKTDLIKEIDDWMKEMKVREHAQALAFMDGTLGRAHLFIDTGEDSPAERKAPLGDGRNSFSLAKVTPKTPIKRLTTVEPTWVYPAKYNAVDPTAPDWLNPETWYVMGTETHRSRLLPFVGREVPDLFKPAFAFGGLSLSQMMKTYVDNWTSARQHIARIIGNFSKNGIKTDLQQLLAPNPGGAPNGEGGLLNRIDLYTAVSDNNGMLLLDTSTEEEFFQYNTPLGTLDALQAQALEQICLPAGMPVVVFLGLTPKGLNASSEGEIQAWEMWVNAYQEHFYGDFVRRMINFAQLSIRGKVDPSIGYKWLPLRTMSDKDVADLQKAKSDRDVAYVDRGILSPEEVRQALKADPMSGYTSIDAEDVPEAPEDDGLNDEDAGGGQEEGGENAVLPFAGDVDCVEVAADVWAWDEAKFEESKHPRDPDGKFASGGGGGTSASTPKSKKDLIAGLLSKGVSAKEVLEATGWPSVSMPAQALAAGMKLEKYQDGGVTKYKGIPLTDAEKAEIKQQLKAKKEAKAKIDAAAKQQTEAPKPETKTFTIGQPAPIDPAKMTKVSGQKGSNPGGVYKDGAGNEFYVKHLKSEDHKTSEYAAAALYKLAGVRTLDYVPATGANVATKFVPLDKANVSKLSPAEKVLAQRDLAVHAWLANWDAVGTGGDNVGVIKGDTSPAVLDVGGSLGYRAQGEPKGEKFGTSVPEMADMVNAEKNPDAAKLYGGMTSKQRIESVARVANVRDDDIRAAVKANGQPEALAEKLIARKFNMAMQFGLKVIEEQEDPEFASKHPRNPDGTFKSTGQQEPAPAPKQAKQQEQPKPSYPKPTEAEAAKAKKPVALQAQYVPGFKDLSTATYQDQAQQAIKKFNEKWEGKTLTDPDQIAEKVADFKNLGTHVELIKQAETANKAKVVAEEKKQAAAKAAKLKEQEAAAAKAAAEKNAAVMKDLGINEQEAEGFGALVKMMGGNQADVVASFKHYEEQAKQYGYPISGFQCALIKNYSNGGFVQINQALRSGSWTVAQHVYVKMVNKAIMGMPPHKGLCKRGSSLSIDVQALYKVGNVVEERAFTSTAAGGSGGFGGNTTFYITAIGKRGTHIKKLSNHPGENEVLFAAKTHFKVTKVEGAPGGQMTVHMEELDDHDF